MRELRADACVFLLKRLGLRKPVLLLLLGRRERVLLVTTGIRQAVLRSEKLIPERLLLLCANGDSFRLGVHHETHLAGLHACDPHRVARNADVARDLLVLLRDRVEVVKLFHRVLDRLRVEQHFECGRTARFVDLNETAIQGVQHERVFTLQEGQPMCLEAVERIELVESSLVQREVAPQQRQALGHTADTLLERANLRGDAGDLCVQRRLMALRRHDLGVQLRDLPGVVPRGGRRQQEKPHE